MRTLELGGPGRQPWTVNVSEQADQVAPYVVAYLTDFVNRWAQCWCELHPDEQTAARRDFGVPSLLVRVDYLPSWNEEPFIFEVEERPQGAGLASELSEAFRVRFNALKKTWPRAYAVLSPDRRGGDDYLWVSGGEITLETALALRGTFHVLPRCEPSQEEFWPLEQHSVSTLRLEGNKQYGEAMGLWRRATNPGELPEADTAFVVKPPRGSKCQGVFIYHPQLRAIHGAGVHTYGRVVREAVAHIEKFGFCYIQPFARPPEKYIGDKRYSTMHRLFFGWDPTTKKWVVLGGNWVARPAPCLRLHGASDGCSGALILP